MTLRTGGYKAVLARIGTSRYVEVVRTVLSRWRRSGLAFGLAWWTDRVLLAGAPAKSPRDAHYLLAPPGAGNIGDQALVEAFIHNVEGKIVVLVRDRGDIHVPLSESGRVEILPVPWLVYGRGLLRSRALLVLRSRVPFMRSFSVVGADIMDGAHNPMASLHRWSLANGIAHQAVPTRILGFSWNQQPHANSLRALRAVHPVVDLFLRDPQSLDRVKGAGASHASLVADMVFALPGDKTPPDLMAVIERARLADRPTALVNLSGLVGKVVAQLPEYQVVVDELLQQGWQVLVLPHVSRPGGDDMPECERFASLYASPRLSLVDRLLSPLEVGGLAASADLVITGRMHLSVLAITRGTPAVVVSTQGKVDGLVELASGYAFAVEPTEGLGGRMLEASLHLSAASLDPAVPGRLRELAMLNFWHSPAEAATSTGSRLNSEGATASSAPSAQVEGD